MSKYSKTLKVITLISVYAKTAEELAAITGESTRQIKRHLKQASEWGAEITCHRGSQKGYFGGHPCYYTLTNFQAIKHNLETWIRLEESKKPLLINIDRSRDNEKEMPHSFKGIVLIHFKEYCLINLDGQLPKNEDTLSIEWGSFVMHTDNDYSRLPSECPFSLKDF